MKKTSIGNIDFKELKDGFSEIKKTVEKAKEEYSKEENKNGEEVKQTLGSKILGIIILVGLLIGCGWAIIANLDTILLPKNSINIVVSDEAGDAIEGLKINIRSMDVIYNNDYESTKDIVILGAKPGKYMITFETVPEGYVCDILTDTFELEQDGKIKLEYECRRDS